MGLQTTVGIAKVGTNSLRVTVPEGVVSYLDIHERDRLDWSMEIIEGKKAVIVKKAGPRLEDALDKLAKERKEKRKSA